MSKFSWLHFSDIHFSSNEKKSYIDAGKKSLLDRLNKGDLPCDYVFLTGDIVDKDNYDGAEEYINNLIEATKVCKNEKKIEDCVFWVPGNHDINRNFDVRTNLIYEIRKEVRKDTNRGYMAFDSAFGNEQKRAYLVDLGMRDYFSFSKKLGLKSFSESNGNKNINQYVELPDLNIILLNTSLLSTDDDDEFKLFVVEKSLINIVNEKIKPNFEKDNETKKPTIILAHHGVEFLHSSERERLGDLLENKADLYLCGHSHHVGHTHYLGDFGKKLQIHEITCGGESPKNNIQFMYGQFNNGKVYIKTYTCNDDGIRWEEDENKKELFPTSGFDIERFKYSRKLDDKLTGNCKIFIVGSPGVGKTSVANKLSSFFTNDENLEVIEVDFTKDVIRERDNEWIYSLLKLGIQQNGEIYKFRDEQKSGSTFKGKNGTVRNV